MGNPNLETVGDRAKVAWKAFSVQALAALASFSLWWPSIEAAAHAALGDKAQTVIQTGIAIAGIFGWLKPQASVSGSKK